LTWGDNGDKTKFFVVVQQPPTNAQTRIRTPSKNSKTRFQPTPNFLKKFPPAKTENAQSQTVTRYRNQPHDNACNAHTKI
jgi:hypothetical protein